MKLRNLLVSAAAVALCLSASTAEAQRGGRGGAARPSAGGARSPSAKPPGGNWTEHDPQHHAAGGEGAGRHPQHEGAGAEGAGRRNPSGEGNSAAAGAAAANRRGPNASGAEGAAAGAAAANRRGPNATGAQGAAAGAAAANRNEPKASGAQGAAAGAAAVNRNEPKATGAQGAAAGAAAAERNAPQASGAEGAAVGAAAVNRNEPNVSGAEGAALGAAAANRNQPNYSGAAGAAAGYAAVRNNFTRTDLYSPDWHAARPGAWTAPGWGAGAAYAATPWNAVAAHAGYNAAAPNYYNYGRNVVVANGAVVADGQNVGTPEEYSQQASDLAQAGAAAETTDADKWIPLGVFAMVKNAQQNPQLVLQLAMNQAGVVRGNYTDEVTEHTQPIQGSVDPKTQRAAWTVGDNSDFVMEAGVANLTQGEAVALIHKNGRTERWMLVRIPQPGQQQQ